MGYTITGFAAAMPLDWQLRPLVGNFVVTGQSAAATADLNLATTSASFTVTGSDASLTFGRELLTDAGAFAVTGQDAVMNVDLGLATQPGEFLVTGFLANLDAGAAPIPTYQDWINANAKSVAKKKRPQLTQRGLTDAEIMRADIARLRLIEEEDEIILAAVMAATQVLGAQQWQQ
jgi:hypothetical protein